MYSDNGLMHQPHPIIQRCSSPIAVIDLESNEGVMDVSKLPAWFLSVSLLLISVGFIVSLYALDEPRTFAGLEFGPKESSADVRTEFHFDVSVDGRELPSNGGNQKSAVCPENSYMIGARFQIDRGGPSGIVSNIFPVCRAIQVAVKKK